jgi:hypothetical protein
VWGCDFGFRGPWHACCYEEFYPQNAIVSDVGIVEPPTCDVGTSDIKAELWVSADDIRLR